jgi:hypothetical protein
LYTTHKGEGNQRDRQLGEKQAPKPPKFSSLDPGAIADRYHKETCGFHSPVHYTPLLGGQSPPTAGGSTGGFNSQRANNEAPVSLELLRQVGSMFFNAPSRKFTIIWNRD